MAFQDRDQTTRIYRGETRLKGMNEEFTLKESQKFVDKVLARKYIKDKYGWNRPIVVLDGRGRSKAGATFRHGQYVILLPKWARHKFVILHELAHHLSDDRWSHGAKFATCLLDLVRNVMGKEDADKLQAGFHLEGVRLVGSNGNFAKARLPKSQDDWFKAEKQRQAILKQKLKEISMR